MMTSELLLLYASTVVTVNAEDATCIDPTLYMSPTPLSSGWQWTRSAPLYLGASDMTASGVFRAKDHEMVLLSAESERQKDKRVSGGEGKGETAAERVWDGDKECGRVNKKTEEEGEKKQLQITWQRDKER